ncbi:MAG: thioredoxin domain-containing protein [Gammaproteobacteria bacterium]|nr:thioredoxin domain-containing protein [Gammaproteobacteria bacterium]
MATVAGQPVPYAQLLAKAGTKLDQLNEQRDDQIRTITLDTARERAAYLQTTLDTLVDERVLALEAAARKTTPAALLATVVIPPVTDAQMQAFYAAHRSQIDAPYARVAPQLRQYLVKRAAEHAHRLYLQALRNKYSVAEALPPYRETVAATGPVRGPADAPITIVEFSDFQCPFCGRFEPELQRLLKAYPTQIRLVYRYLPLESIHPEAMHAAAAGVCADRQGKFWPMHDLMFREQDSLAVPGLMDKAKRLGLDVKAFADCLSSAATAAVIAKDQAAARRLGLSGTPSTFVDGRFLNGAVSYDDLVALIDDELHRQGAVSVRGPNDARTAATARVP